MNLFRCCDKQKEKKSAGKYELQQTQTYKIMILIVSPFPSYFTLLDYIFFLASSKEGFFACISFVKTNVPNDSLYVIYEPKIVIERNIRK